MGRGVAYGMGFLRTTVMVVLMGLGLSGCSQSTRVGTPDTEEDTLIVCQKYEKYHDNGRLKEKGCQLSDSTWHGLRETYHPNGNIALREHWKDGRKHGESVEYYTNGKDISVKGNYVAGQKQGEWMRYRRGEDVLRKGNYVDGQKHGEWVERYGNGNIKSKGSYVDGRAQGEHVLYYRGGNLHGKTNHVDGKGHGEWVYYHENGNFKEKKNYVNGELHGEWVKYYGNGNVKLEVSCLNGKLHGLWAKYGRSGRVLGKARYRHGSCVSGDCKYFR